jgi:hypothetical protein
MYISDSFPTSGTRLSAPTLRRAAKSADATAKTTPGYFLNLKNQPRAGKPAERRARMIFGGYQRKQSASCNPLAFLIFMSMHPLRRPGADDFSAEVPAAQDTRRGGEVFRAFLPVVRARGRGRGKGKSSKEANLASFQEQTANGRALTPSELRTKPGSSDNRIAGKIIDRGGAPRRIFLKSRGLGSLGVVVARLPARGAQVHE